MRRVAEADDRIEMIAHNIARHYRENFMADGFKGQVAAARYYQALDRLMPKQVTLLISDPPKGEDTLWDLRQNFSNESAIIEQFLNDVPDKLGLMADKHLTASMLLWSECFIWTSYYKSTRAHAAASHRPREPSMSGTRQGMGTGGGLLGRGRFPRSGSARTA